MSQFAGTWKFDSTDDKFQDYLKEVGVGFAMRKLASAAKPTLHITVEGNHYVIKQESSITTTVTEFDLDKEFDEKLADGRECKSTVKLVDGKLIQDQRGKYNSTFERWVEGDFLCIVSWFYFC